MSPRDFQIGTVRCREFTLDFPGGRTFAAVDDLSTFERNDLVNVRLAALALPVVATLLASSASASTVILSPLGTAPQHVATLSHSCAVPNAPAQIREPFFEYPTVAKLLGAEGVAAVGVSLSPAGRVVRAWRIQSSGNMLLDRAALNSAHNSSYVAERAQCGAVAGDYKLEVEFSLKD